MCAIARSRRHCVHSEHTDNQRYTHNRHTDSRMLTERDPHTAASGALDDDQVCDRSEDGEVPARVVDMARASHDRRGAGGVGTSLVNSSTAGTLLAAFAQQRADNGQAAERRDAYWS